MIAVGGADPKGTGTLDSNAVTAHEAFDAPRLMVRPCADRRSMNARGTIAFAVLVMEALDVASNSRFAALGALSGRVRQA